MRQRAVFSVLMAGDVVGEAGRATLRALLPELRREYALDLVVVNAENADGLGLHIATAQAILKGNPRTPGSHADILTLGDHIYDKSEIYDYLPKEPRIVRPLNFMPHTPGQPYALITLRGVRVMIVSCIGLLKIGIYSALSPFLACDNLLAEIAGWEAERKPHIILVDFHAEDMTEKQALAWYLDGRVSAVVGTHTHVPTLDARVLPKGTGRVTDLGMCGPRDGSLGMNVDAALTRFLHAMPAAYSVATGANQLCAVVIRIDEATGKCLSIERADRVVEA